MNKKLTPIVLIFPILLSIACNFSAELPSSPVKPATIHDPLLLEAWTALYSHQKPVQMPDRSSLSGRDLAQFVINQALPVEWAPVDDSHQTSYSTLVCQGAVCHYGNDPAAVAPLYITPSLAAPQNDQLPLLVERLAHEIYHRMQPFGQVQVTLFEEYSAYFLSSQISGMQWANFNGYDALDSTSLTRWFVDHNLMYAYQQVSLYPQQIKATVKQAALSTPAKEETTDPTVATPEPQKEVTCTVNLTGWAVCEDK